jgi:dsRNA-specific ribonuclease
MVATAVEAILGAVEIDGGRNALARVMKHLGLTEHALLGSVKFSSPDKLAHLILIGANEAEMELPRDLDL